MTKIFKLPYWCKNCGDGSVVVNFTATIEDAEDDEEKDLNEYGLGWGESSASYIELKVEEGKLFFKDFNFETLKEEWIEIKT